MKFQQWQYNFQVNKISGPVFFSTIIWRLNGRILHYPNRPPGQYRITCSRLINLSISWLLSLSLSPSEKSSMRISLKQNFPHITLRIHLIVFNTDTNLTHWDPQFSSTESRQIKWAPLTLQREVAKPPGLPRQRTGNRSTWVQVSPKSQFQKDEHSSHIISVSY